MTYIEGFVIPVPTANRQQFINHAGLADKVFMEEGATRILECWEADVPHGTTTDFFRAVDAKDDEAVVFSWIEWPDKANREAMMAHMEDLMQADERFSPEKNPMPFDGKRMIYGGFAPIVSRGSGSPDSYVQGFIVPVPRAKQEDYRKMADDAWDIFREYGALRLVEAWGDDVPEGKLTDFHRAVKATDEEDVVFSLMEWPSREVCDAAQEKMMQDDRMKPPEGMAMPFDGKRMVYGGFTPVVQLGD